MGIPVPDMKNIDEYGLPLIVCGIAAIYIAAFLILYLNYDLKRSKREKKRQAKSQKNPIPNEEANTLLQAGFPPLTAE